MDDCNKEEPREEEWRKAREKREEKWMRMFLSVFILPLRVQDAREICSLIEPARIQNSVLPLMNNSIILGYLFLIFILVNIS